MVTYNKPNLPDPGHDRWWEIQLDGDYWELILYKENESPRYNSGVVVDSETIFEDATAKHFEEAARGILTRLDKAASFVGTYHKN